MNIAILGAGMEGKALAKYFLRKGNDVALCDARFVDGPFPKGCKTKFGKNYLTDLEQADMVFRSPGIPFLTPAIQRLIKKGINVSSLTKYFFEHCPCRIIGITGTKGKGTTAVLLHHMLKDYTKGTVYLGGNIGAPPIDFLDDLAKNDLVILELSSFQLQDLDQSPHAAIVLSITPDHLDHHHSFEEYVEAKRNITRFQKQGDILIVNEVNELSASFADGAGNRGIKTLYVNDEAEKKFLMDAGKLITPGLIGTHNLDNILAAALLADEFGIDLKTIQTVIKEFKGLPHRLQLVTEKDDVAFYDDSCSTTPETCIAAIQAFSKPTILIAGGSDKGADYAKLGEALLMRLNVKTVVLMGETKTRIAASIDHANERLITKAKATEKISEILRRRETPLEIVTAETYQEAFMVAKLMAKPGDIVLLSPAAASFDQFRNYQERGEVFQRFVMET